ncbi:Fic family protein [Rhodoferax antarcticus]|uniref:Fic family protein n=1 Tax=Rhodoferax antarcticus TaxID=81479 RepID=UPI00095812F0|nr:Fic family protein [Rhodoferax antarcticus]APW48621.1 cell filamentation protein Fic [Rhodoferax antarcticus]APW48683.1 cell filamentation protein Fic [Rhodoferax antarcticus]
MQRDSTGFYAQSIAGAETVRAFVPHPLPPTPALDLSGARQQLLEQASLAVGRLDALSTLLPDPQLFLYAYVRREAVLSSQIEGTQSSLSDLLLFELDEAPGVPFDDVQEVSNYIAALEHGMARLREGFPLCNRLLREMHAHLMKGARGNDKAPGEFRRSQNWIGGTRPGNARFVPQPPQELEACMAALEGFLHNTDDGLPTLVRAALAHVQFETIHPFLDGNGRLGRLLIALMLHHGGLLQEPLLYLSLYLKQHRAVYYELLGRVRTHGDWEAWVDFFLEGVQQTASGAVSTAQRLVALFAQDTQRVQTHASTSARTLQVLNCLRQRPVCALKQLATASGLSFPTASKAVQALVGLGLVHELTGRRRNRVFVYSAYLAILNEGGEPL